MQTAQIRRTPPSSPLPVAPGSKRGLGYRDAVATFIGIAAGIAFWAAYHDWGWPALGSTREGIGVLAALGVAMCAAGANLPAPWVPGPFVTTASILGSASLGVVIAGLISGSDAFLVALAALIGLLWIVTTTRHAMDAS